MNIKVNGKDHDWCNQSKGLTYDALCFLARVDPGQAPSATYRFPNGASGVILRGTTASVVEGGRYSVYHI